MSAPGVLCAKTTVPMAVPGTTFPTTTPVAGLPVGNGIRVVLNKWPITIESAEDELILRGSNKAVYKADLIIEATGRVPNLSVLEGNSKTLTSIVFFEQYNLQWHEADPLYCQKTR